MLNDQRVCSGPGTVCCCVSACVSLFAFLFEMKMAEVLISDGLCSLTYVWCGEMVICPGLTKAAAVGCHGALVLAHSVDEPQSRLHSCVLPFWALTESHSIQEVRFQRLLWRASRFSRGQLWWMGLPHLLHQLGMSLSASALVNSSVLGRLRALPADAPLGSRTLSGVCGRVHYVAVSRETCRPQPCGLASRDRLLPAYWHWTPQPRGKAHGSPFASGGVWGNTPGGGGRVPVSSL